MAWSLTHAKLHTFLRKRILLPHNSRILMAVSGGQDSLCLARLLLDMRTHWQWSLAIAHCDHQWREDSAANAAYVAKLAGEWQLPCWVEVAETPVESESAAREWRYVTLAWLARAKGYTHVVTGHTASDRAETVLYNLIRGTGLDGIGTLPWGRPIDDQTPPVQLVRPLLAFSRTDTADFCQAQQIRPWEDSSNQDLSFRRNRIRQELLPYLREHFNPQVERSLSQMAETVAMDVQYIERQASELYERAIAESVQKDSTPSRKPKHRSWTIDRSLLRIEPLALQHRVIRQVLQKALPHPPNFQQIQKLVDLIEAPNGSRSDPYPGGLVAQVDRTFIQLVPLS